jgi:hypothetical protein
MINKTIKELYEEAESKEKKSAISILKCMQIVIDSPEAKAIPELNTKAREMFERKSNYIKNCRERKSCHQIHESPQ